VKILLAVDGSSYSEMIVWLVKALKMGRRAEATLLTVIPEHVFLGGYTLAGFLRRSGTLGAEVQKGEEERASKMLARLSKPLGTRGPKVYAVVRRGSPADEIIKLCRSARYDLVVVGNKGTDDAPEFLIGSVAHKVIKYAPCSVLVAKRESRSIATVLVPFDGSKYANEVVRFLLQMPLPRDTEVVLMTAVQAFAAAFVRAYTPDLERDQQIIAELQRSEEAAAERLMSQAQEEFRSHGYKVSAVVARGDPSPEILREAARRNVDLIALGAKGLTGVRGFLLGSVAQRVTRHARSSVLVVRPPKD
jgi:nucleotide-binding universal stress UspA family protein